MNTTSIYHRLSEDHVRLFLSGESLFATGRSLQVIAWSAGAERLLGFSANEALGKSCCQLISCDSGPEKPLCHEYFAGVLSGSMKDPIPSFDCPMRTKSGRDVPVNVSTVLVSSEQPEQTVLIHLLRDLSHELETFDLLHRVASHAAKLTSKRLHSQGAPPLIPASPAALGAAKTGEVGGGLPSITAREKEVLLLLAEGTSTDALAGRLFISPRTARNHIQNLLAKLGVHSRLEAVALARSRGLI
jgi:PAS domain S-box-containing protein